MRLGSQERKAGCLLAAGRELNRRHQLIRERHDKVSSSKLSLHDGLGSPVGKVQPPKSKICRVTFGSHDQL